MGKAHERRLGIHHAHQNPPQRIIRNVCRRVANPHLHQKNFRSAPGILRNITEGVPALLLLLAQSCLVNRLSLRSNG